MQILSKMAGIALCLWCFLQPVSSKIEKNRILSSNTAMTQSDTNQNYSTIINLNKKGLQVTRFDSIAAAIDAHDGEIALFNGVYYLYGTSYDCGYEWGNKQAPFCGFKSYSSKDLVNWKDQGFLFDAQTDLWQTRCNGATYGCYRPHVIFNEKTKLYVLWINVYDNRVGFRVFTSETPIGPFTEIKVPTLAVNNAADMAGLNNGDHDTFVDDDGVAYIAYTDWRTGGSIVIERLNDTYTSGTGQCVKSVTPQSTEAPALMKRNGIYYVLYSDPNCGYCSGTGTSYRTAKSPLGPWSEGKKISENSCGGQPSFVSTFKLNSEELFLYGSDLWNNAAKNESLANFYWAPLTFAEDGSINPIVCQDTVNVSIAPDHSLYAIPNELDNTSGTNGFTTWSDIGGNIQRSQSFIATRTGILSAVSFTSFQKGYPNAGLTMAIYKANESYQPIGKALSSKLVPVDSIGWSPKDVMVYPEIAVEAGIRYTIVVKTSSTTGNYGLEYNDSAPYKGGGSAYSSNSGSSFTAEKNRTLMFKTFIRPGTPNKIENATKVTFNVYPNPVMQYLKISLETTTENSMISILNPEGQQVLSKVMPGTGIQNLLINMSSFKEGMYILNLEDGVDSKAMKIIKK